MEEHTCVAKVLKPHTNDCVWVEARSWLLLSWGMECDALFPKQVVAMTCTHAALKRHEFLSLGFQYDNLLMEEAGQILEVETFIPMLLQVQDSFWRA